LVPANRVRPGDFGRPGLLSKGPALRLPPIPQPLGTGRRTSTSRLRPGGSSPTVSVGGRRPPSFGSVDGVRRARSPGTASRLRPDGQGQPASAGRLEPDDLGRRAAVRRLRPPDQDRTASAGRPARSTIPVARWRPGGFGRLAGVADFGQRLQPDDRRSRVPAARLRPGGQGHRLRPGGSNPEADAAGHRPNGFGRAAGHWLRPAAPARRQRPVSGGHAASVARHALDDHGQRDSARRLRLAASRQTASAGRPGTDAAARWPGPTGFGRAVRTRRLRPAGRIGRRGWTARVARLRPDDPNPNDRGRKGWRPGSFGWLARVRRLRLAAPRQTASARRPGTDAAVDWPGPNGFGRAARAPCDHDRQGCGQAASAGWPGSDGLGCRPRVKRLRPGDRGRTPRQAGQGQTASAGRLEPDGQGPVDGGCVASARCRGQVASVNWLAPGGFGRRVPARRPRSDGRVNRDFGRGDHGPTAPVRRPHEPRLRLRGVRLEGQVRGYREPRPRSRPSKPEGLGRRTATSVASVTETTAQRPRSEERESCGFGRGDHGPRARSEDRARRGFGRGDHGPRARVGGSRTPWLRP